MPALRGVRNGPGASARHTWGAGASTWHAAGATARLLIPAGGETVRWQPSGCGERAEPAPEGSAPGRKVEDGNCEDSSRCSSMATWDRKATAASIRNADDLAGLPRVSHGQRRWLARRRADPGGFGRCCLITSPARSSRHR
jgi:hypothetical protein